MKENSNLANAPSFEQHYSERSSKSYLSKAQLKNAFPETVLVLNYWCAFWQPFHFGYNMSQFS